MCPYFSCFSNKSAEELDRDMFSDTEWSYKEEDNRALTERIKKKPPTMKKIRTEFTSASWRSPILTRLSSKNCFLGQRKSATTTPSMQTLQTLETIDFSTIRSLNSLSSYWRDYGEIMSYDGTNERVSNRYDIGVSILKAQIQNGADPRTLTTHGDRSSLMFAVLAEDFGLVKQLVGLDVDVNQTNRSGESALSLALMTKRKDIADYLRLKGAVDQTG